MAALTGLSSQGLNCSFERAPAEQIEHLGATLPCDVIASLASYCVSQLSSTKTHVTAEKSKHPLKKKKKKKGKAK